MSQSQEEIDKRTKALILKYKISWIATGFFLPNIGIFVTGTRMRLQKAPKSVWYMARRYAGYGSLAFWVLFVAVMDVLSSLQ